MTPTPTLATAPPLNSHKRSSSPAARSTPPKRARTWVEKVSEKQRANGEETDEHRVAQRQKQIDYGKNTLLYDAFVAAVPRDARLPRHPMTPLVTQRCSKRSFVGQVRRWRRMLFEFSEAGDSDIARRAVAAAKPKTEDGSVLSAGSVKEGSVKEGSVKEYEGKTEGSEVGSVEEKKNEVLAVEEIMEDGISDYEEDDGVQLDDMGNVISIAPMESVASAVPMDDEPVSDDNEMSAPVEEPTIFDQF